MTEEINIYYIPQNPHIKKGSIYTLYINNNTNLDLQSVITNIKPKQLPAKSFIISEKDYTRLLELTNLTNQLTNKRTTDIQNFLNEETKIITELTKLDTERQELIKKITKPKKGTQK